MHNDIGRRVSAVIRKSFIIGLVSLMPFSNSILAGETLVRNAEQSEGFQSGVQGWRITRAGDAEFNNLTARGELIVGPDPGQHIHVGRDSLGRPIIEFYTGDADESAPGYIRTSPLGQTRLEIASPDNANAPVGSILPEIDLQSWSGVASTMNLWADETRTNVPIRLLGEDLWTSVTRVNSWVDFAGARLEYTKDGVGRVQLRGQVASGTAAQVGSLGVGYRPTQTMEWVMRAAGGVTLCAVQVTNAGAINVTANLATAQASGIRLDSISFPALY